MRQARTPRRRADGQKPAAQLAMGEHGLPQCQETGPRWCRSPAGQRWCRWRSFVLREHQIHAVPRLDCLGQLFRITPVPISSIVFHFDLSKTGQLDGIEKVEDRPVATKKVYQTTML